MDYLQVWITQQRMLVSRNETVSRVLHFRLFLMAIEGLKNIDFLEEEATDLEKFNAIYKIRTYLLFSNFFFCFFSLCSK